MSAPGTFGRKDEGAPGNGSPVDRRRVGVPAAAPWRGVMIRKAVLDLGDLRRRRDGLARCDRGDPVGGRGADAAIKVFARTGIRRRSPERTSTRPAGSVATLATARRSALAAVGAAGSGTDFAFTAGEQATAPGPGPARSSRRPYDTMSLPIHAITDGLCARRLALFSSATRLPSRPATGASP